MADLEAVIGAAVERADGGSTESSETTAVESESTETTTDAGDETAETVVEAPAETPAEAKPDEEDAPDLTDAELKGRVIPVPRHKAVLTKARRQAEALQKQLDDLKWATDPQTQEKLRAIDVADKNPEMFARVLADDPRFAGVFKQIFGVTPTQAQAQTPPAPAADGGRPQPDVLLPDGTPGYSAGAAEKLTDWKIAQFSKTIDERLGKVDPLIKRSEAQQAYSEAVKRQTQIVENARAKWPGFKEHEPEIRSFLLKPGNEQVSLDTAYREVVVPRFQTSADAMRKQIIAELNKKPAAAVKGPQAQAAKATDAARTIEDVIRGAVEAAGGM